MNNRIRSDAKIYVAGHTGLVGAALLRVLDAKGYRNVVRRTRAELDLTDQAATRAFFKAERPSYVFIAAGMSGGLLAHRENRAEFIYQNLAIQTNLIRAAFDHGVRDLLFLASNNIYPKLSPLPLKEGLLLTGLLDPISEPEAIAKIAGIKMCSAFNRQYDTNYISVVPAKAYGPGGSFDPSKSHVLSALIGRLHGAKTRQAREAVVWGSGNLSREFIFCDDLADACVFLMEHGHANRIGELINIGTGSEITIKELAQTVARIVGYGGRIVFDTEKADCVPRKRLDSTRINALGWKAKTNLIDGITNAYRDFLARQGELAGGEI